MTIQKLRINLRKGKTYLTCQIRGDLVIYMVNSNLGESCMIFFTYLDSKPS